MSTLRFSFVTDTATLCVYDVAALKHRLSDDSDWWCGIDNAQVTELNGSNVAFIDLGSDGRHVCVISSEPLSRPQIEVQLRSPSGSLFVGAAEEVTSDGMEPDCTRGGVFYAVGVGAIALQVSRSVEGELQLSVRLMSETPRNAFSRPLELP